ncbi:MAG: polysaccharide pyruvyl transferase family protein [Methanobacteriaceae archaeon]|nr:polysaccharide pyruvyl transferase family protein [Methanobacteriaceae archaeon]MDO9626628.1 polysaccharide pyruvyl transferase family protein [Methanobacteriaceae archaeon]
MKPRNIGLIRAVHSNKGDMAIFEGSLEIFSLLNIEPTHVFDVEPGFPSDYWDNRNIKIIDTSLSSLEKNRSKYHAMKFLLTNETPSLQNINDLDFIWYMGGSRFNTRFAPHVLAEILNAYYKKKILNSKLILGGISTETPSNSYIYKNFYRQFAKNVEVFFIRDKISLSNLSSFKIPEEKLNLVIDFAFWLNSKKSEATVKLTKNIQENPKDLPIIGVIPVTSGLHSRKYSERFINMLKKIQDDYSIFFIPTSNNANVVSQPYEQDDYAFCLELNSKLEKKIPILDINNLEPSEIIEVMKKLDFVISMRMHGAIFGVLANVPTLHIYYRNKGLGFFKTFFKNKVHLMSINEFMDDFEINNLFKCLKESIDQKKNYGQIYREIIIKEKKNSFEIIKNRLKETEN